MLNNGAHAYNLVRHSPDPMFEQMRQRLDEFDEMTDALAALQRGGHAFVSSEIDVRLLLKKTVKVSCKTLAHA